MAKKVKKDKKNWFKRSTRIVGMDPLTFEESWRVKINRLQLISISLIFILALLGISYLIFSYTPLGYLLPENIKNRNKQKIEATANRAAILENKIVAQDKYIHNLQKVILGEISIDSVFLADDKEFGPEESSNFAVDTTISNVEMQLDQNIKNNIEQQKATQIQIFDHLFLFDPVKGEISRNYRIPNHPGVDIVTPKGEQIKACLHGVVLHSSYDDQDGHTIILSHENEIVSVYKHAQKVFVKVGEKVSRGKAIGVVGNTGERSTGPHLHFEIWSDMGPLDPLEYFSFGN